MIILDVQNRKQFIYYMKPYGNHCAHILGDYYTIRKVNMEHDMYEVKRYDESYNKENSKRLYINGCEPVETFNATANECVKIIIMETRKLKLEKLCSM